MGIKLINDLNVKDYATSLPPLQDLLRMTGVVGPGLLGKQDKGNEVPEVQGVRENKEEKRSK